MPYLDDIMDVNELARLVADRYVNKIQHPSLPVALYNYTEKATFDRVWTAETRQCRGLVVDTLAGAIVAHPFDKFSNIDESGFPESAIDVLLARPGTVEITDKLDGSMVVCWEYRGRWHCSTRGSFTSEQAKAARRWIGERPVDLDWEIGQTYIGEWCAPDNRVVLKYDSAEWRLIGIRNAKGRDERYPILQTWAMIMGVPIVRAHIDWSLSDAVAGRSLLGCEGWVARWPDGHRVKIKTEDYIRLHRLITGFSAARVRDALLTGDADRYVAELPEEIRPEAERIWAVLTGTVIARSLRMDATYQRLAPLLKESRKAFALAVQQENPDDRPYLFALADNKPFADKILKSLDLHAIFGELAEAHEESLL